MVNKKYVLEVDNGAFNSAGTKAKADVTNILKQEGFIKKDFFIPKNLITRMFKIYIWSFFDFKGMENSTVVFQHPIYSNRGTKVLLNIFKRKNIKAIAIIHDIEALRNKDKDDGGELKYLNDFDSLIVHNEAMKQWLITKGIKTDIQILEIFDYLNDADMLDTTQFENLIYAGNLIKSPFLTELDIKTPIMLKGPNPADKYPDNITYGGQHTPDELPAFLQGKFGLVWDGNSSDTCSGEFGEYLRFNNPHKTSLYLSMGVPVVIWNEAALAPFIRENNCGLVVSSLAELDDKIKNLSSADYALMVKNTQQVGKHLREGYYTKKAVKKAMSINE